PGASGSPTRSATCSSTTPPTAGWPCWRPPWPTACPAKPSCNVSSAANSKPCTCAPDAEKACVSSPHPPRKDCFDHDNQRKAQCDTTSKQLAMSVSTSHRLPCQDSSMSTCSASCVDRFGRNPKLHDRNPASKIGSRAIYNPAAHTPARAEGKDS